MLRATSGLANGGTFNNPTFTGNVTGAAKLVAQWAIPFIGGPSGTMANNGAVTWGTALPNAYTGGAWVLMPAGSIATGVPAAAAWLWYVGTNTATGTFFNSTYMSGTPTIGTATAFATTGAGAFTGVLAETAGPTITVAANSLGPNGALIHLFSGETNSTAGAKTFRVRYSGAAGTVVYIFAATSGGGATALSNHGWIRNRGVTSAQVSGNVPGYAAETAFAAYPAVDTTASSAIVWTFQRATATDVQVVECAEVRVSYGA